MRAVRTYAGLGRRAARRVSRQRRGESGQALTEFAIVAPLIVMVLLFAIWFVELLQIKLKVQEAARYAAWEATSYKLHDYDKGPSELSKLSWEMTTKVSLEAIQRYMDLDSTTAGLSLNNEIFAASWTPPLIFVIDQQEELVYGGPIVNFLFSVAGTIFDFVSALTYKGTVSNPVALSLIAAGKDYGGAMTSRMFGNSAWGFNRNSYAMATAALMVKNNFVNRGVGSMLLPSTIGTVMLTEKHAVLADPWHLEDGRDVPQSKSSGRAGPGVSSDRAYWKQIDRMYFIRKPARQVGETWIKAFKLLMDLANGLAAISTQSWPDVGDKEMAQATVVSRNYTDDQGKTGQVTISQDNGTKDYDTAPVGLGNLQHGGGDLLKDHGKTLKARGKYFMGCDKEMSLGCPSSTLSQDNPFGDYIKRE
jgi:hypothetical protein